MRLWLLTLGFLVISTLAHRSPNGKTKREFGHDFALNSVEQNDEGKDASAEVADQRLQTHLKKRQDFRVSSFSFELPRVCTPDLRDLSILIGSHYYIPTAFPEDISTTNNIDLRVQWWKALSEMPPKDDVILYASRIASDNIIYFTTPLWQPFKRNDTGSEPTIIGGKPEESLSRAQIWNIRQRPPPGEYRDGAKGGITWPVNEHLKIYQTVKSSDGKAREMCLTRTSKSVEGQLFVQTTLCNDDDVYQDFSITCRPNLDNACFELQPRRPASSQFLENCAITSQMNTWCLSRKSYADSVDGIGFPFDEETVHLKPGTPASVGQYIQTGGSIGTIAGYEECSLEIEGGWQGSQDLMFSIVE